MDEQNTPPQAKMWDEAELAVSAEKAKLLQALFANQLFVQPDGLHLRMSFGERVGGEAMFHTAFVVPNSDALSFGQLLVSMAESAINQQVDAMKQAFAPAPQDEANGD